MDHRRTVLLLGPLLLLLASAVITSVTQNVYTNSWAVHISGGAEQADFIAKKHGFINLGNIAIAGQPMVAIEQKDIFRCSCPCYVPVCVYMFNA
ncbi:furin-1-like [Arapaima gigas]